MGAELFQTIGGLFASVLVLGFIVGIATCRRTSVGSGGASVAFIVNGLSSFFNAKHASALASGVAMIAIPTIAVADVDKRVALVIGNGAYLNAPKLDNPTFDARAVADEFRKLGFQVVDGYDLDIAQMREKVSEFSAALPGAKSAVIYYAGHGVSVDEENYLIPIDIVLRSPTDLDLGAISVPLILRQMKREDRVNVVILDACRDNPFAAALAKNRTRAIIGERGLSRIDGDLARGTLIAFASDPKSTALDGPAGQHSPFTSALLDHIADPGVSIDTVMSRVRTEVWEKTNHNQLPWVNTSLIGDYRLNPQAAPEAAADAAKAPASPVATGDRHRQEDLLWESAQHSNLSADYQAYLDAFPNGMFSQMARNRIAVLQDAGASGAAKVPESIAARAPEKVALAEPAAPSEKDWKAEIGSAETEKALDLTSADQREIQQRLIALRTLQGSGDRRLRCADPLGDRGMAEEGRRRRDVLPRVDAIGGSARRKRHRVSALSRGAIGPQAGAQASDQADQGGAQARAALDQARGAPFDEEIVSADRGGGDDAGPGRHAGMAAARRSSRRRCAGPEGSAAGILAGRRDGRRRRNAPGRVPPLLNSG